MKKAVTVFSIIAIVSVVFFTALSLIIAFYNLAVYEQQMGITYSSALETFIIYRIASRIVAAVIEIALCFYLLFNKAKSYALDVVLVVVRFGVIPVISAVVSYFVNYVMGNLMSTIGSSDYALYSIFNAGMNNFLNSFDFSTVLLIFAFAFTIAVKIVQKGTESKSAPAEETVVLSEDQTV